MPEATLKLVAKLAGVAPTTVSRVINGSERVSESTRAKILGVIREVDYAPNMHAANLRRKRLDYRKSSSSDDASHTNTLYPRERTLILSPKADTLLAQQMARLRKDLDRLKRHAERMESCVDDIQKAYSRQLLRLK